MKRLERLVPAQPSSAQPASPANAPLSAPRAEPSARLFIVGREIVVAGDIKSCDCLVIEGTVKANVSCRELRIAEGGLFIGTATVATAEIRGRFEGELQISERLSLRASGSVAAKLRYRQIEVERGGQISGDIRALDASAPAQATEPPRAFSA